jgi:hypothetical protein
MHGDQQPVEIEDRPQSLVKTYLIVGWAALVLLAVVSGLVYRQIAVSRLVYEIEGRAFAAAQRFSTTTWPDVRTFVRDASELETEALRNSPEVDQIDAALRSLTERLPLVGIRLYNRDGLIVYATHPDEIGMTTADPLVPAMVDGRWYGDGRPDARTELAPIEMALGATRVVITHVALRRSTLGAAQGVLEIRQNVTAEVRRIARVQWITAGSVVGVLTLALATARYYSHREAAAAKPD